jgi:hypothetical protein
VNPATIFFMPATFADVEAAPVPWLGDPIDPTTGEYLSIEFGFWPIDSHVITAIRTERGSGSAVQDVGQQYRKAPLVDTQLPNFFRLETALALKHLTDEGDIVLRKVEPLGERDAGTVKIDYQSRDGQRRPLIAQSPLATSRL